MDQARAPPRLMIVTNIPTPYRISFFNELSAGIRLLGGSLEVAFCAHTEHNRQWVIDRSLMRFPHVFMSGTPIRIGDATLHLNPEVGPLVRRHKPNIVLFAGSWLSLTNLLGMHAARAIRSTCIFWSEGHTDATRHTRWGADRLRKAVLKRFDVFAVPNPRSEAWIQERVGPSATIVRLPNTVDDTFFHPPDHTARQMSRQDLHLTSSDRVLLQVSQLHPKKGCQPLVEAFYSNATAGDVLCLLGEGPMRAELGTLIEARNAENQGRILLPGFASPEIVRRWLWAADALVLNSFVDPNPLASIEGALCGLPLLMSARAGNVLELLAASNGWTIEDPSCPDDALKSFFATPIPELRAMGERSNALARAQFSRALVVEQFLSSLVALQRKI